MSENDSYGWPPSGPSNDFPTDPSPLPAIPPGGSQPLSLQPAIPPAAVAVAPAPEQSTKPPSRLRLLIILAIIGALLVIGGGAAGVFALVQYGQPGAAANQFCQDLKTQNFDSAYAMLTPTLADQYSHDQFHQLNETLDTVEGNVASCAQSGAYNYSLGSSTATVGAALTRGKQGNLHGGLRLVNDNGWKIDAIETSLLGVNPGALQTLNTFCAALQTQDYTTLYGLLGGALRGQSTADDFSLMATLDDLLDGKVTSCTILSLGKSNTDSTTTATVSVSRSTLGVKSGSVTLTYGNGSWALVKADSGILGRDLQPLIVGTTFCLDVSEGDFASAYGLGSASFQQSTTQAQLAQKFALPAGAKWIICSPDMSTYQVSDTSAQYSGTFDYATASNALGSVPISFTFTQEGSAWKMDSVTIGQP